MEKNNTETDLPHLLLCNQIFVFIYLRCFLSPFHVLVILEPFKSSTHTEMP